MQIFVKTLTGKTITLEVPLQFFLHFYKKTLIGKFPEKNTETISCMSPYIALCGLFRKRVLPFWSILSNFLFRLSHRTRLRMWRPRSRTRRGSRQISRGLSLLVSFQFFMSTSIPSLFYLFTHQVNNWRMAGLCPTTTFRRSQPSTLCSGDNDLTCGKH